MSVKDVINSPETSNDVRGALRDWLAGKNDIMLQIAHIDMPGVQRFWFHKDDANDLRRVTQYLKLYLKQMEDNRVFYIEVFIVGGPWWLRIARQDHGQVEPMCDVLQEMLK